MKIVIYKVNGVYYTTTEENYRARIQNARLIHKMQDFTSAEEIIEYYCKYFRSQPDDFIVIKSLGFLDELHLEQTEQM